MTILNTSVSGMLADSNWLSSISQNVANANTTGYKDLETDFSTLVDQASSNATGGGVTTSIRSLNDVQGNLVSSTTTTDLAVQGSGFFVVSDSSGDLYLTRNGSFVPDASGNLVNSAGYYLMGSDIQSGSPPPANALSSLQKVNIASSGQTASATTSASITANLPASATPIAAAVCRRRTRQARPTPMKLRSSFMTTLAAHTRSTSICQKPAPTAGRSTPSTPPRPRAAEAFRIPPDRLRRRL